MSEERKNNNDIQECIHSTEEKETERTIKEPEKEKDIQVY